MFIYKGCTGEKKDGFWMLTYEDGTKDGAVYLKIALMLCDKKLKRGSL
jgi:hypothetical protein